MAAISILVVTWNSEHFIVDCLDSLFGQTFRDFEVVVVDNGSADRTSSLIESNYPQVRLIKNTTNGGACRARNQAIDQARAEWVLTLDCDVVLEKTFLERLAACAAQASPAVGTIQPVILKSDGRTIFSCGVTVTWLGRFYDRGHTKPLTGKYRFRGSLHGGCAAACLYRRSMLDAIKEESGYFDERFFFLVEDVDLAWRAHEKGWQTLLCEDARCRHVGNSSLTSSEQRQYLCFRNRYFMLAKHKEPLAIIMIRCVIYELPRLLFFVVANRRASRALREISLFRSRP